MPEPGTISGFLRTLTLMGGSFGEAVVLLLEGALGEPLSLSELLAGLEDPGEVARTAAWAGQNRLSLATVFQAMLARGQHPLNLLLHSPEFRAWFCNLPSGQLLQAPDARLEVTRTPGGLSISRYRPAPWATELGHLQLAVPGDLDLFSIASSDITGLLGPTTLLGGPLRLLCCEGEATLPWRSRSRIELRHCRARIHFPERMELGGILEILGCPGVEHLPEHLSTPGLFLGNCPGLRALPQCLEGVKHLDIRRLPLSNLPDGLVDLDILDLAELPLLEELQIPPSRSLRLEVKRMPRLRRIRLHPETTLHSVCIEHCPTLVELPAGIQVERSVFLRDLPTLKALPTGMELGASWMSRIAQGWRG